MATERQLKTLQNLAEGSSMADAMRDAGYKESYARNPQQLKEKESWQELLDKYVPEKFVTRKLKELSDAVTPDELELKGLLKEDDVHAIMKGMKIPKSKYTAIQTETGWMVYYAKPDNTNRNSALDKVIKARGQYAPDKIAFTDTEGRSLKDDELDDEIQQLEEQLRVKYLNKAKKKDDSGRSGDKTKTDSTQEGKAKKA
jgi:hypothetical protein